MQTDALKRAHVEEITVMSEEENTQSPVTEANSEARKIPTDLRLVGALVRTAYSSEQTLMSWIRTSLSLSCLGFAIAQFFHYLAKQGSIQLSAGPRRFGLALICVGVVTLAIGAVEHMRRLQKMQEHGLQDISQYFLPIGSTLAVLALGFAALISVFFNWSL